MSRSGGQSLVSVALLLPLVLLPVLAYAVQATLLATRSSRLEAAVARAAEDATAAIDVSTLRQSGVLVLDPTQARSLASASLAADDPEAGLDGVAVTGSGVTVSAHERVPAGLGGLLGAGGTTLRASAQAQLTAGYSSPSSRLPLPSSSFSMTG